MLRVINVFIELAAAFLVIFSVKVRPDPWLSFSIGVAVLVLGIYHLSNKNLRAIFHIASSGLIFLTLLPIQPVSFIWIPVGVLMFAIAAAGLIQILIV